MERYFDEPYRFIPPHRGTFWCGLARRLMPRHLRKKMGVSRWHFEGIEHLGGALRQQAGILIASNHCRWSDPMVLGVLAAQLPAYLYYVASYHLFRQSKVMGWILNRIGGYSTESLAWVRGQQQQAVPPAYPQGPDGYTGDGGWLIGLSVLVIIIICAIIAVTSRVTSSERHQAKWEKCVSAHYYVPADQMVNYCGRP